MLFTSSSIKSSHLFNQIVKKHVLKYRFALFCAFVCMIVSAITTALLAKYLKPVFDDIFMGHKKEMLHMIVMAVMAVFVLRGLSEYGESLSMDYIGQKMVASFQKMLFSHIVTLDVPFFHQNNSAMLLSVLTNDITLLRSSITQSLVNILKDSLTIICLVGLMLHEDMRLSLISFLGLPLVALPIIKCGKRLRKISFQSQEITSSIYSIFSQVFQGICLVKSSMSENYENARVAKKIDAFFERAFKASTIRSMVHPIMEVLSGVAVVTVIFYGGSQVIAGTKSTGSLISFITALLLLYKPLKSIMQFNNQLQEGLAAADRIFHIMNIKPSIEKPYASARCASKIKLFQNKIQFQDVSFRYSDETAPIFEKFSCEFECGKRLALVGHSGAGKTSLFFLLLRFYRPQSGKILIDGENMETCDVKSTRNQISLVSQNITLFDDTIRNNIAYGCENASIADIKIASQAAFADEFIDNLSDGYDTFVGENGVRLSGGQRQRIALARAFLKKSPLLLLDEATSALDTNSEKIVQKAIFNVTKNRTSIIIAHRISTIESSDKIYVMQNGKIIEEGDHSDLIRNAGAYALIANS